MHKNNMQPVRCCKTCLFLIVNDEKQGWHKPPSRRWYIINISSQWRCAIMSGVQMQMGKKKSICHKLLIMMCLILVASNAHWCIHLSPANMSTKLLYLCLYLFAVNMILLWVLIALSSQLSICSIIIFILFSTQNPWRDHQISLANLSITVCCETCLNWTWKGKTEGTAHMLMYM